MILQDNVLVLGTKCSGNVFSFLKSMDYATKPFVDREVVVEKATVLVQHFDRSPKG